MEGWDSTLNDSLEPVQWRETRNQRSTHSTSLPDLILRYLEWLRDQDENRRSIYFSVRPPIHFYMCPSVPLSVWPVYVRMCSKCFYLVSGLVPSGHLTLSVSRRRSRCFSRVAKTMTVPLLNRLKENGSWTGRRTSGRKSGKDWPNRLGKEVAESPNQYSPRRLLETTGLPSWVGWEDWELWTPTFLSVLDGTYKNRLKDRPIDRPTLQDTY